MAFTPCAADGAKYAGGASTFFLRLVAGGTQMGGKLQFCANHATEVLDSLRLHYVKVSEGDKFLEYTEPMACGNCGGAAGDNRVTFYGNAYPRGNAESQWYGLVCAKCFDAVVEDFHLDKARRS
jgi:hypothetical protein